MKQTTATLCSQSAAMNRTDQLHPAWLALIRLCRELDHGEIEKLRIQNGLPVLVEQTRKKIKLT